MTEKDLIIQDLRRENAKLRARVPEWISVDDRLPENIANRVLVVCERSNGVFYAHYEKPFWINLETDKPFISTVTHWMQLPELPKENDYGKV